MSKLLTHLKYTISKVYPKDIDLSSKNTFYAKDLTIQKVKQPKQLPPFDVQNLIFGKHSTDHMATVFFDSNTGWGKPKIVPFAPLKIHPFNSSLHYAVQCFEGLKAYKDKHGKIRLFRPQCNALRLKRSSTRISLPDFDGKQFIELIKEYVKLQERWIPVLSQFSLYLRPLHISMEDSLGVKNPSKSQLLILGCPVGPYYPTGFLPVSLSCGVGTIRSAPGGTGSYKVGGNYGPTLGTTKQANTRGHQQVLWLYQDSKIIQVGASNIFFVFKGQNGKKAHIVTPALEDLILPGVTRDSIITYLQQHPEYSIEERVITIQQVIERNKKGDLLQCFSAGTAVVIGSVRNIEFKGENIPIYIDEKLQAGPITYAIRKDIVGIQQGNVKDTFGWTQLLN